MNIFLLHSVIVRRSSYHYFLHALYIAVITVGDIQLHILHLHCLSLIALVMSSSTFYLYIVLGTLLYNNKHTRQAVADWDKCQSVADPAAAAPAAAALDAAAEGGA
jgi:hypothetical protein